jgi:hypothetical protein
MRVQDALQNMPCTWQTDPIERGAQKIDRTAVERFERVTPCDDALFHERFLCGE